MIDLTAPETWNLDKFNKEPISRLEYFDLFNKHHQRNVNIKISTNKDIPIDKIRTYLLFPSNQVITKTIANTTQYGSIDARVPFCQHYRSRNPILQRRCINEPYATNICFTNKVTSYEGYTCAQIFVGINSGMVLHYGMCTESNGPDALLDFFRQECVPMSLL